MATRPPLAVGEWYHCYNRGVDKRKIFATKKDYDRFLILLYAANSTQPVEIPHVQTRSFQDIVSNDSLRHSDPLVEMGAYALMPNHIHLALKEIRKGGIATFMQKVSTGYTMYFNKKNERTGALFSGTYKSKHVADDQYIKKLVDYIHLNPVELMEPGWKIGKGNVRTIQQWLLQYVYSSLPAFQDPNRLERRLLGDSIFTLYDRLPTTAQMLTEAQEYYQSLNRPEV